MAHQLLGRADVHLVADRDAESVASGGVMSTQVKFPPVLDMEAAAGLNFWRSKAPEISGISFRMVVDGEQKLGWTGRFSRPAQSVDQRTTFSRWMSAFADAGGDLEVAKLPLDEIDRRAQSYDLTVVTRADRDLLARFATDTARPVSSRPLRQLSVLYLDGVQPDAHNRGNYVALPGLGEFISYPGLTGRQGHERRCEMVLFEGIAGSALDAAFASATTPQERLATAKSLIRQHLPADLADRFRDAELTDAGATLAGAVTPAMRHPVTTLPSGTPVLGAADVVCRMDPGGAQGANNAVRCGFHYGNEILHNLDGNFDQAWLTRTADAWLRDVALPAARWTEAVLDPPPALQDLMFAAADDSALADAFADTFIRPANLALVDPAR
ncbi:styrene monooxygenase/indole monooxygenase family protein [Nocardia sp. NPDC052254]|uniref:styrene monooxygenase/indole monooxygenase family protein n=1 Tax=Nocardia sp. NPDC052254 TaxID=3155681 RepID=UPI0034450206